MALALLDQRSGGLEEQFLRADGITEVTQPAAYDGDSPSQELLAQTVPMTP
jgi:hypothetical protein